MTCSYFTVDGKWGAWAEDGDCSVTCGSGFQPFTRACDFPSPRCDGGLCEGSSYELRTCTKDNCPCLFNGDYYDYQSIVIDEECREW